MNEVYRDNVYAPFLENKRNLTILDIGANIGVTVYYFSQFAKVVHAIEPSAEHFDVLTHMIAFNGLDNVKAHKYAIHIKEQNLPLFHNPNKTMYSLHTAVDAKQEEPEQVHAIPLDKFFKDNNIEHVDFMKLDCEGSEYEIVASEGFRLVSPKIDTVFLEYHDWAGRHPNQLYQALENNGYTVSPVPSTANLLVGQKK